MAVPTVEVPTALTADSLIVADFADDEDDDLLVTSRGTRRSQLFTAIDGTLSTVGVFPSGAALAAGDLDSRLGVDLVAATDATLTTLVSRSGEFVVAQSLPLTGRSFVDLQIAQFDGDARPDVLALDALRNVVFAMSASTSGTLTSPARQYPILPGAQRLLALPVTPAADVSLAVTFRSGNDVVVYRPDETSFTATGSASSMNSTLAGILGGPVTPDRCHDIVTWHASGARIDVHASTCTGGLAPHVALRTFLAAAVTLADTDGDGDRDLIVTHRPPGLRRGYFSVWLDVAR